MSELRAYGDTLAQALNVKAAPAFVSRRTLNAGAVAVTQVRCEAADNVLTTPVARDDAILVMLQMRPWPTRILWADDRPVNAAPLAAGAVSIFDLRTKWVGHRVCPINQLNFYLPRAALDELCDQEGSPRVQAFDNDPCAGAEDQVIAKLGQALEPAFSSPEEADPLFIDHVTHALAAHVLRRYGVGFGSSHSGRGVIDIQRIGRAQELLAQSLDGIVSVAALAQAAGMSPSEFTHAFVEVTGLEPYQWLRRLKVDRALQLLRGRQTLAEVARGSGFASERELSRAFRLVTGMTPSRWRQVVRH